MCRARRFIAYYTTGELKAEGSSITEGIGQGRITANLEGLEVRRGLFHPRSGKPRCHLRHAEGRRAGSRPVFGGQCRRRDPPGPRNLGPARPSSPCCAIRPPAISPAVQSRIPALEGPGAAGMARKSANRRTGFSLGAWSAAIAAFADPTQRGMTMTLSIGSIAPDFTAETTHGNDQLPRLDRRRLCHPLLASQGLTRRSAPPNSVTSPGLEDEFEKRNTKVIGLSVDPLGDHRGWLQDIKDVSGNDVELPDHRRQRPQRVETLQHASRRCRRDGGRPHRRQQRHRTDRLHRRPRQDDQGDAALSDEHRPQLRRSASPARQHPADRETFASQPPSTGSRARNASSSPHCPTKRRAKNSRTAGRR